MKLFAVLLLIATAVASKNSAGRSSVTPVQKVIQLMDGMLAKGKKEKNDEQVQYAAYKQFCDDTTVEKERAISEAEEQISMLKATIEKNAADAAKLKKEVAEHEADISTYTGDHEAATTVRTTEKATYDATHKDYSESIDALERAIAVVKKQAFDREQTSFVQLSSSLKSLDLMPRETKRLMDAFLAEEDQSDMDLAVSAPEAAGYEFQSSGVIEMLSKLHDKFTGERTDLEKTEMNSKHAYDMLSQDLTTQITQAKTDRDFKAETSAKKLESKAKAEGDLEDTTSTMEADKKYLSELTATCEQKASDFESRQSLRTEEITAIEKAIQIISSGAVSGNAEKHLPSSLLGTSGAFAQLRAEHSAASSSSGRAKQAARYLKSQAAQLKSRTLAALAARVTEDPFAKVKKMIKDLIVRLMEEAGEEAEHKAWCDTELSTNEQTRKEKTEGVEMLHAEIDELEASIAKATEEIALLTKEVAELDAAIAKATELRQEEKAKNEETIQDSQEAQTAVAQALTVLKDFYAKAGEATAFLQQQPEAPEIFDSPYKGMQSENGGVVGMLEVIESDFARLESETKASEATAQKEYDEFVSDSKVDKEAKATDIEHKTSKKQDETQALTTKKEDLEGTQKELDAALAYFDKLKPSCVDAGVSYEDRVARRKEEIESLQEALKILNGEEIA
jgi:hypothetical protein